MRLKVNLVVLNFNGKDLLRRFLPSVAREAQASRHDCRVTVIDNRSSDGSVEWLKSESPGVYLVQAPENKVLCSYNDVVRELSDDVVILLNNDMELLPGFVDPLVEPFLNDPNVFFAATHGDRSRPSWRWGILSADISYSGYESLVEKPGYSFSAGVAAFDRKKFLELGGYDERYLPGRYEDVDLCYRGWRRGWKGVYVFQSRKEHVGGASFHRAFSGRRTQALVFRNAVLFMVKNVADHFYFFRFLALLPLVLAASLLRGRWFMIGGFLEACERFPAAWAARRRAGRCSAKTDRDVLRFFREDERGA